jgi:hypothetical protein
MCLCWCARKSTARRRDVHHNMWGVATHSFGDLVAGELATPGGTNDRKKLERAPVEQGNDASLSTCSVERGGAVENIPNPTCAGMMR